MTGVCSIDLPVFGEDGEPRHERGVADGAGGLYFVGLHFLYAMSSTMIHGVGRDAVHVARQVRARAATRRSHHTDKSTARHGNEVARSIASA